MLCDGYYRQPCVGVGLKIAPLSHFFITTIIPATATSLDRLENVTVTEELAYWRLLGHDEVLLKSVEGALRKSPFVWRRAEHVRVSSVDGGATLKNLVTAYIIENEVPYVEDLSDFPAVVSWLTQAEALTLNRKSRDFAAVFVRPLLCTKALIPNCISMLFSAQESGGRAVVPDVLWNDPDLRRLVMAAGVSEKLPCDCFVEAARIIEQYSSLKRQAQAQFMARLRTHESNIAYLQGLAVSVVQAAVALGNVEAIEKIKSVKCLLEYNDGELPKVQRDSLVFAPNNMVPHKDRLLAFTQLAVMHPALDDLPVLPLIASKVAAHLVTLCNAPVWNKMSVTQASYKACCGYLSRAVLSEEG